MLLFDGGCLGFITNSGYEDRKNKSYQSTYSTKKLQTTNWRCCLAHYCLLKEKKKSFQTSIEHVAQYFSSLPVSNSESLTGITIWLFAFNCNTPNLMYLNRML
jgi:hypothetical protein